MSYNIYIQELATKVNYLALQQYLLHKGWKKILTKREDAAIMVSPDDNPNFDLLIPLSRTFADYGQSITLPLTAFTTSGLVNGDTVTTAPLGLSS